MRRLSLFVLLLFAIRLDAQAIDWQHVDVNIDKLDPKFPAARLSLREKLAIGRLLVHATDNSSEYCGEGVAWTRNVSLTSPLLGARTLIEVGVSPRCPNHSVNTLMWLVEFVDGRPVLRGTFSGWGLGVQQHVSHGLHDVITGGHVSAAEFGLAYYRFDGRTYRLIGHHGVIDCATLQNDSAAAGYCYSEGGRPLDSSPLN